MKKIYSFLGALAMGLLAVAPPEFFKDPSKFAAALKARDPLIKCDYYIPVVVNSFAWLYAVIAAALLTGFMVVHSKRLHPALKVLLVYTFVVGCFYSAIPYFSFTAFMVLTVTTAFFILFMYCEADYFFPMAQAVFWLEFILASFHAAGMNTLTNFGRTSQPVFLGTILQHMRFGSLLCILSPILLVRNRLYIVPILAAVILTTSSGFAVSMAVGLAVYGILNMDARARRRWGIAVALAAVAAIAAYALTLGRDSFRVAIVEGRLPIWWVCLKTWALDTRGPMGAPDFFGISQTGPFDLKAFIFGHGLDTFYALFPAYKHDPAPFPQAHNSWIQVGWELGLVALLLIAIYLCSLVSRLARIGEHECIAGLAIIGTNMVFHFPDRMTQTVLPILFFVAYCEQRILARAWASSTNAAMRPLPRTIS